MTTGSFTWRGSFAKASEWLPFAESALASMKGIANGAMQQQCHQPDSSTTIMVQTNPDTIFIGAGVYDLVVWDGVANTAYRATRSGDTVVLTDVNTAYGYTVTSWANSHFGFTNSWTNGSDLACSLRWSGPNRYLYISGNQYYMFSPEFGWYIDQVALTGPMSGICICTGSTGHERRLYSFTIDASSSVTYTFLTGIDGYSINSAILTRKTTKKKIEVLFTTNTLVNLATVTYDGLTWVVGVDTLTTVTQQQATHTISKVPYNAPDDSFVGTPITTTYSACGGSGTVTTSVGNGLQQRIGKSGTSTTINADVTTTTGTLLGRLTDTFGHNAWEATTENNPYSQSINAGFCEVIEHTYSGTYEYNGCTGVTTGYVADLGDESKSFLDTLAVTSDVYDAYPSCGLNSLTSSYSKVTSSHYVLDDTAQGSSPALGIGPSTSSGSSVYTTTESRTESGFLRSIEFADHSIMVTKRLTNSTNYSSSQSHTDPAGWGNNPASHYTPVTASTVVEYAYELWVCGTLVYTYVQASSTSSPTVYLGWYPALAPYSAVSSSSTDYYPGLSTSPPLGLQYGYTDSLMVVRLFNKAIFLPVSRGVAVPQILHVMNTTATTYVHNFALHMR